MKNTRLYLNNWSYNASIILQELENIVLSNGGAIVSTWKTGDRDTFTITNRTLTGAIEREKDILNRINEKFGTANNSKLLELEAIPNDPITNYYGNWFYICFTIGDTYYYYSMDDNPFFDFHMGKRPIVCGTVSPDYYLNKDGKKWLYDCFFTFNATPSDRKEAAENIYKMLLEAPNSSSYRGNRRPQQLNVLEGEKTWY